MKDQAERLRMQVKMQQTPPKAKTVAVVSGKGGVGKSNFLLNFSVNLSEKGKRVLLFDMDIGMENIDILLGYTAGRTIVDCFEKGVPLQDVVANVSKNVSLVCGGTGLAAAFSIDEARFKQFYDDFVRMETEYDYILFDFGAGIPGQFTELVRCVDEVVAITTPEPASLMDAYSMIKYIHFLNEKIPVSVVCNRAMEEKLGRAAISRLQSTARDFLGKKVNSLGCLPDSKAVLEAVMSQVPFLVLSPTSDISIALNQVTANYLLNTFHGESTATKSSFLEKLRHFFSGR